MFKGIDLFSDTVTQPNEAMKRAMLDAHLGDEQRGEDPTTKQLEERMAQCLGKTAALFFPSATMCNQVAIALHCQAGDEVIGAETSHVFTSESGGVAAHARAQARMIPTKDGRFTANDLKNYCRFGNSAHTPISRLVIIENTSNSGGGSVWSVAQQSSVLASARELGLRSHLDGARLFNASIALGVDVRTLAKEFDTVTICFSKGLSCPLGAVLAFDERDFSEVRRLKQLFGGAMRQSGMLAAACLYALDHNVDRLNDDHASARLFDKLVREIPAITIENSPPETNMVFFAVDPARIDPDQFSKRVLDQGLRFSRVSHLRFRAVTHSDVGKDQIHQAASILRSIIA